jgi:hypothetical protein
MQVPARRCSSRYLRRRSCGRARWRSAGAADRHRSYWPSTRSAADQRPGAGLPVEVQPSSRLLTARLTANRGDITRASPNVHALRTGAHRLSAAARPALARKRSLVRTQYRPQHHPWSDRLCESLDACTRASGASATRCYCYGASNGQLASEEPDRKAFCGRLSYRRDAVRGGG